jgi:hypothetical protein
MSVNKKKDEILYQAYLLMEKADIHEKAEEYISAIYKYQKSAEILKQYGLEDEKIEEIHTRISDLDILYDHQKQETKKPEKLEKMAFEWIEAAKDLEIREKYQSETVCYNFAIDLLSAAGWDDSQLEQFRKKNHGKDDKDNKINISVKIDQIPKRTTTYNEDTENYINRAQEFEVRKQTLKNIQIQAFGLIDEANKLLDKMVPDYDKSIELYKKAYMFLIQAGWTSEAEYLNTMIENIYLEQKRITEIEDTNGIATSDLDQESIDFKQESLERVRANEKFKEEQKKRFREFQEQKKNRYATENDAINLMNIAEKATKINDFSKAAEFYKKATESFKKIGWSADQLDLIQNEVDKMKVLQGQKEQEQKWASEIKLKKEQQTLMNKQKEERKVNEDLKNLTEISSMIKASAKKKNGENKNLDQKEEISPEEKQIMEDVLKDLSKDIRKAADNVKKLKKN